MRKTGLGESENEGGFEEVGGVEYPGGPGDSACDRVVLVFRDGAAVTGRALLRGLELVGLAAIGLAMLPVVLLVVGVKILFGDFDQ